MIIKEDYAKVISIFLLFLLIFITANLNVYAVENKASVSKIVKIQDINVTIVQKSTYLFPPSIRVTYDNKKEGNTAVVWGRKSFKADNVGSFSFKGKVSGSSIPAKLNIKVIPPITKVEITNVKLNSSDNYSLPAEVLVTCINGSKNKVNIKWAPDKIDTSKIGTFNFLGNILGYDKKVNFTVEISNIYSEIKDISETVYQNQDYKLPKNINATLVDGTPTQAPIVWSIDAIDTKKIGTRKIYGTVVGYDKKVNADITVIPDIKQIPTKECLVELGKRLELPNTLRFDMTDGSSKVINILWNTDKVDVQKEGVFNIVGKIEGFSRELNWTVNVKKIVPVNIAESIKSLSVFVGDKFKLPATLKAEMNDGTTRDVPVVWNPSEINFDKVGKINTIGKVNEYSKEINWTFEIKSDFTCFTKEAYYTKWGYFAFDFNKNIKPYNDLSKIELTSSDGVTIGIMRAQPSSQNRTSFIITPARDLEKNKSYKLAIPKNTIQAENGEYFSEDLVFNFNY